MVYPLSESFKDRFSMPTVDAIALSFGIHANKLQYVSVKGQQSDWETKEWIISNRSIFQYLVGGWNDLDKEYISESETKFFNQLDKDWPRLNSRADYIEPYLDMKEKVQEFTDIYVLDILTGELSEFDTHMVRISESEEIGLFDMGFIGYIPYWYLERKKVHDEIDARMEIGIESKEIGEIGKYITMDLEVRTAFNSKKLPGSCVIKGHDGNGNLVLFFTKMEKSRFPIDTTVPILGKVKEYRLDNESKAPMTQLNYVKLMEDVK